MMCPNCFKKKFKKKMTYLADTLYKKIYWCPLCGTIIIHNDGITEDQINIPGIANTGGE